jgi:hypothetical protein
VTADVGVVTLFVAVTALPMLAVAVVLVMYLVRSARTPDDPGLRVVTPGDLLVRAHVTRPGQDFTIRGNLSDEVYGVLLLRGADLVWQPGVGPGWQTPVGDVSVLAVHAPLSVASPSVDVDIAGSGTWRLEVSDRTINRIARNDAKRRRQARVAVWFAHQLTARGARDLRAGAVPAAPSGSASSHGTPFATAPSGHSAVEAAAQLLDHDRRRRRRVAWFAAATVTGLALSALSIAASLR